MCYTVFVNHRGCSAENCTAGQAMSWRRGRGERMRILHITDLHAGGKQGLEREKEVWERLYREVAAVTEGRQKIDIIAVTGDLVTKGAEEEYRRVENYLQKLMEAVGLEKSQVFFCCGNHDADTPDAESTFKGYEEFIERFYGGAVPQCPIPVYSINSCKRTSWKRFNDCWLDPDDVDEILKKAEPGKKGILLLHHQPEIFDDQTQMERLNKAVGLILGGHLHTGYTRQITWKGMTVVNGMAVTPHLDFIPAGFQIVEWKEDKSVETVMYVFKENEGVIEVTAW